MEGHGLRAGVVLADILVTPVGSESLRIAGLVDSNISVIKLVIGPAHAHGTRIFAGKGKGSAHLKVGVDIQAQGHADPEIARPILCGGCRTGEQGGTSGQHQPACIDSFHKSPLKLITPLLIFIVRLRGKSAHFHQQAG